MKRRAAVEPVIGHVKADHRMNRNDLKGQDGDRINAVLAAAGFLPRAKPRIVHCKTAARKSRSTCETSMRSEGRVKGGPLAADPAADGHDDRDHRDEEDPEQHSVLDESRPILVFLEPI
jgi:hypothetical protein